MIFCSIHNLVPGCRVLEDTTELAVEFFFIFANFVLDLYDVQCPMISFKNCMLIVTETGEP